MLECEFSEIKVLNKLKKINIEKSPRDDGIYSTVINKCAEELAIPLSMLFKQSFETGSNETGTTNTEQRSDSPRDIERVPVDWRRQNITPIFKKGKKCKAGHRPVSLTSMVCKVILL